MVLIGVGAGSYRLYLAAIRLPTQTCVAVAVTASPLGVLLCGTALLGEPIGPATVVGFAAGVVLVNLRPRSADRRPAADRRQPAEK